MDEMTVIPKQKGPADSSAHPASDEIHIDMLNQVKFQDELERDIGAAIRKYVSNTKLHSGFRLTAWEFKEVRGIQAEFTKALIQKLDKSPAMTASIEYQAAYQTVRKAINCSQDEFCQFAALNKTQRRMWMTGCTEEEVRQVEDNLDKAVVHYRSTICRPATSSQSQRKDRQRARLKTSNKKAYQGRSRDAKPLSTPKPFKKVAGNPRSASADPPKKRPSRKMQRPKPANRADGLPRSPVMLRSKDGAASSRPNEQ
jgi:hypothetical protein